MHALHVPFFAAILFIVVIFCTGAAYAGEVTLWTPQSEYDVLTGEDAAIPLTIVSTYDHDITGTLTQTEIPVNSGNTGSRAASVQTRDFSAFTEQRTVSLPVGRSDVPADYLVTISFSYQEGGGRSSTLDGIVVHFVTGIEDTRKNQDTRVSTDTANTASGTSSEGSASRENTQTQSQAGILQNARMPQDTSALRNQLAGTSNQSNDAKDPPWEEELLGYLAADPLLASINRSLTGAGFTLENTNVTPVSNSSGSFVQTYSAGTKTAVVKGNILGTHVTSAEESSYDPIPLPDALLNNTTYRTYGSRMAEKGALLNQTRITVTPDRQVVDLTYAQSRNRMFHAAAVLRNGTVVSFAGDNPDDPLAVAGPALAIACVLFLSCGIWYLARYRQKECGLPQETIPKTPENVREIAGRLLDEAKHDASRGAWPDAYRKTGRALRIVLSYELGTGNELTSGESEQLLSSCALDPEKIHFILDRCQTVGFAKGTPDPREFRDFVLSVRTVIFGELRKDRDK